jgi:hypothetical protein
MKISVIGIGSVCNGIVRPSRVNIPTHALLYGRVLDHIAGSARPSAIDINRIVVGIRDSLISVIKVTAVKSRSAAMEKQRPSLGAINWTLLNKSGIDELKPLSGAGYVGCLYMISGARVPRWAAEKRVGYHPGHLSDKTVGRASTVRAGSDHARSLGNVGVINIDVSCTNEDERSLYTASSDIDSRVLANRIISRAIIDQKPKATPYDAVTKIPGCTEVTARPVVYSEFACNDLTGGASRRHSLGRRNALCRLSSRTGVGGGWHRPT